MNVTFPAGASRRAASTNGVSAVLGPTNTGKTHYAIERMLAHPSGMIGLPLRLLAREVYNRVVEKIGPGAVALITGEEKIKPKGARYFVSTVEAMPRDLDLDFVAVDEIQLAADLDRGHVFTDRLLHHRGRSETLLIGAATMQRLVHELLPGVRILDRPRLSKLSFAGERKMTRLPRRSAIVAFSAEDVYAIAEWIRRQRGGAAVVLGALSPRTRNAQVDMFQNGDVDYIVATDAVGMGLNLDVEHIAFASDRKFDGWQFRRLTPAEFGQIAGRAGRHMRDGTFGTTGRCPPFDEDLVEALEAHRFDSVRMLQWRNASLDFSSIRSLAASLDVLPNAPGLTRAPLAEDQMVLDIASREEKIMREAATKADVARLWDCCQIPDYRKLSPAAHAELVLSVYGFVVRAGRIPDDWFARHIRALDRVDGDLDALSARIAQVRTWTFIANRSDWLLDPDHWQGVARQVEDTLSDALHARLAQRFVDRRTSVLMRRLRENAMLEAEVTNSGDVIVEGQHVGQLNGFRFTPDPQAVGEAAKALNAAAQKALASEIEGRATRVHEAVDEAFVLANDGMIRWLGEPVAKISAGPHVLEPTLRILADEQLTGPALENVQRRLDLWLAQHVKKLLGPLVDLEKSEGLEGLARGVAFQIAESLGVLDRAKVAEDVKALPQEARGALRKFGVRFGAYHLYLPGLVKPAPRALAAQLWALTNGGVEEIKGIDDVPHLAASGRTSFVADKDVPKGFYRAAGFRVCGERAVRVDILERLADLIRPAIAYRPGATAGDPPAGAADGDSFIVTVGMTSLAGCSGESFASILRSLGYVVERRAGPAITVPLVPKAATEPLAPPPAEAAPSAEMEGTIEADHGALESAEPHEDAAGVDSAETETAAAEPGSGETIFQDDVAAVIASEPDAPVPEAGPDAAPDLEAVAEAEPVAAPEPFAEAPADDENAAPAAAEAPELTSELAPDAAGTEAGQAEPEPVLIEVWRPHRQHFHARRPEARAAKRPERRRAAPHGETPELAAPAPEPGAAEVRANHSRPRNSRGGANQDHGARERQGGAPSGAQTGAPGKPGQRQGRPNDRDRHERQGAGSSRPQDNDRRPQRGSFATPQKKSYDRPPDPNSPFAKLLVLKASMEEKNKQDS
ncbi:helicase-related protein [Methylocella silvestris]|uniref:Helicase n=1 Tax=Methylocella silvestris TaxID=199596 RepID=A0A2J7TL23_METSI|nr:helicase-related protein [Methylocella silvestris]PNG27469.1 helicase [Methylocella silvestris]